MTSHDLLNSTHELLLLLHPSFSIAADLSCFLEAVISVVLPVESLLTMKLVL